jgi:DNA modification methylase
MMMKISTDHSQVVLDPFMDAGDVGEAAILQDRDFIGIEISRARFDDTERRLDDIGE